MLTQTATPDVPKVETPTMPPMPNGGKEIVDHDGKKYVLTAEGVPVFVLDGNDWEPFTRPIVEIMDAQYFNQGKIDISGVDLKELDESQVVRLKDGEGNNLSFGYWFEMQRSKPGQTLMFISGTPRGCVEIEEGWKGMVFEMVTPWERQILVLPVSDYEGTLASFWVIPGNNASEIIDTAVIGDVHTFTADELFSGDKPVISGGHMSTTNSEFAAAVCKVEAKGNQIVVGLQTPPLFYPDGFVSEYDENAIKLREIVRNGDSMASVGAGHYPDLGAMTFIIPGNLLKK